MMHCTMEDLVALRAGEGSAWARGHAEGCAQCRAELEALYQRVAQLKALPVRRPPRDRWPVVREAAASQRRTRRARRGAAGLAAAALLAGLLFSPSLERRDAEAAELAQAKAESATLEEQLDRYDPDARVMSGRTAALAAALEDRIAMIDGALAQLGPPEAEPRPAELVNLWRQRVDLMQQLVGVRVARATYIGL